MALETRLKKALGAMQEQIDAIVDCLSDDSSSSEIPDIKARLAALESAVASLQNA